MNRIKNHNLGNLNAFLSREGDTFFAHLLEFNIMAEGKSFQEAFNNLLPMIIDYVEFFIKLRRPQEMYDPAPQEYWDILNYYRLKKGREMVVPTIPQGLVKEKSVNRIKKYLNVFPPQTLVNV